MWLLDKFLGKAIRRGRLTVTDYDGQSYDYGPGGGEEIRVRLTNCARNFRHDACAKPG